MEFTAETLLRWLEHLADKHKKTKMREKAWEYVLAIVGEDYTTAQELLNSTEFWWKDHHVLQAHVFRGAIETTEQLTPVKASGYGAQNTPANSSLSRVSAESAIPTPNSPLHEKSFSISNMNSTTFILNHFDSSSGHFFFSE